MEIAERGCWSHRLQRVLPRPEAWAGSPFIHPAPSGLFLHLFKFTFSIPLPWELGSVFFPGRFQELLHRGLWCVAGNVEKGWGSWGKNWTLFKDSTKYSEVIRIWLEQVINESSMAVTGQSNIYRTSSISIAAAERKQWIQRAPGPARGTRIDRLPQNLLACVYLLPCPGGGWDRWGGGRAKRSLGLCSIVF